MFACINYSETSKPSVLLASLRFLKTLAESLWAVGGKSIRRHRTPRRTATRAGRITTSHADNVCILTPVTNPIGGICCHIPAMHILMSSLNNAKIDADKKSRCKSEVKSMMKNLLFFRHTNFYFL